LVGFAGSGGHSVRHESDKDAGHPTANVAMVLRFPQSGVLAILFIPKVVYSSAPPLCSGVRYGIGSPAQLAFLLQAPDAESI
jgi:hypothetical protein